MLSADRQSYWVHLIVEDLLNKDSVQYSDKSKVIRAVQRAMSLLIEEHNQIEKRVLEKIVSLKRNVQENSPEWAVLHSRYYDAELSRSRLGRL